MAESLHRLTGSDGKKMIVYPDHIHFPDDELTISVPLLVDQRTEPGRFILNDGSEFVFEFDPEKQELAERISGTIERQRHNFKSGAFQSSQRWGRGGKGVTYIAIAMSIAFVGLVLYLLITYLVA